VDCSERIVRKPVSSSAPAVSKRQQMASLPSLWTRGLPGYPPRDAAIRFLPVSLYALQVVGAAQQRGGWTSQLPDVAFVGTKLVIFVHMQAPKFEGLSAHASVTGKETSDVVVPALVVNLGWRLRDISFYSVWTHAIDRG